MSQFILYSSLQVFLMYCLSLHTTVKDLHAPKYSQTSPLFTHLLPSLAHYHYYMTQSLKQSNVQA